MDLNLVTIIDSQIRKFQRKFFESQLLRVQKRDFTIVSSNCLGGLFYQLLRVPYTTPTVGLFFFAPCYLRFITYLPEYLQQTLVPLTSSRYPLGNIRREINNMYPLGELGDVEIHFMHYSSWEEATEKWNKRVKRMNFGRLFFIFTDKDLCSLPILQAFDQLPYPKKVCFTSKKYTLKSCIQIPEYGNDDEVGNLVADYHLFHKRFDFVRWFDEPA